MRGVARRLPSLCVLALFLLCVAHPGAAAPPAATGAPPSIAFYYGAEPPVDLLGHFDRVVVEADHLTPTGLAALSRGGTAVFAYVSVGEVNLSRPLRRKIEPAWLLGNNASFDSVIVDQTQSGWREALLEGWVRPLWQAGYRGFFLDTLDSYQSVLPGESEQQAQAKALAVTLRELQRRFPGAQLLLNRGFEVLPELSPPPAGVVAESLFRGYRRGLAPPSAQDPGYFAVKESDRTWLIARLHDAQDRYHVPITVIDYVPGRDRALMRATASRIAALGFAPWVSDPDLNLMGVGAVEAMPRRVLALWSSREQGDPRDVAYTEVHRLGAMPLEYLGYAVDYVDADGPLPEYRLAGRYAGVVTWFTQDLLRPAPYRDFLQRNLDDGVRFALLGNLGLEPSGPLLRRLGLRIPEARLRGAIRVKSADAVVGFEAQVQPRVSGITPIVAEGPDVQHHLVLQDGQGHPVDAVFTAPFGGVALDPYVVEEGHKGSQRWIIDPFAFYQQALGLTADPIPAADVTTQDGRRLLLTNIDGDGFVSRAEMPRDDYAGKVILEEILKKYPQPTTVSIIEGEVGPLGKYPEQAADLEAIARDIFRLPNVEVATHTYSHPFDWHRLGQRQTDGDINGLFACEDMVPKVVGCDDKDPRKQQAAVTRIVERDILGSVEYINRRLAPPDKKVKVVLWSGNAIAPELALRRARQTGLLTMNGGDTAASRVNSSLTNVSSIGRPAGAEYQVYAPVTNENIYTNLWRGPFYGFRDVISTFQITGSPRRLKPIDIYYHFYSGTKIGALAALRKVYDWALAQNPLPVYVSDYVSRVEDFQHLSLGRRLDGGWQVRGSGKLRTLRLPPGLGRPDLARSQGVTGVWDLPEGRYVGLVGSGHEVLYLVKDGGKGGPLAAAAGTR